MSTLTSHKICRDADAPWWELRISTNSSDCYRPHTHDEYSLGIVDEGSATFRHAGDSARIGVGAVVMIEPQVVHSCNPVPIERWSYRMLFIQADWLHAVMANYWGLPQPMARLEFLARCVQHPLVTRAVDRICSAHSGTSAYLAENLPELLSGWARPNMADASVVPPAALAPAVALMQSAAGISFSVAGLAETCGMTPTKFIREFSKCFGMTPAEYLQDKRVNGARRLIATGMPICEAALEMGFSDQAHLQRTFKARHAMTPGCYRR